MTTRMVSLLFLCAISTTVAAEIEMGYYWLDYRGGNMFKNALRLDANSDVYVGQLYTKQYELLPAAVRTSPVYATTYAYAVTVTSNDNIKVLCSQFLNSFKWVRTHTSSYGSLPNLVQGGTEVGSKAYIGRLYVNGQAVLGKLGGALVYTINGGPMQFYYGEFEVLTYEKPMTSYCAAPCFPHKTIVYSKTSPDAV